MGEFILKKNEKYNIKDQNKDNIENQYNDQVEVRNAVLELL